LFQGVTSAVAEEVEELADRLLHRPLARPIVRLVAPTRLTPNHVTLLSGASGILAAVCIAASSAQPPLRLVGALLVLMAAVLDCADGQLARLRGRSSPGGGALDGLVDEAVGSAVILSSAYVAQARDGPIMWLIGLAALVSAALHCLLFDAVKERYLARFGVPHTASKLAMADAHARATTDTLDTWLQRLFHGYVRRIRWLADGLAIGGSGDRDGARRRMRVWATLGLGTHMALGYVALAVSAFWPPALYWCLILFSTLMNAQLAVLVLWERSVRAGGLNG
jgi:phosphatidylglycerophosphate synthase